MRGVRLTLAGALAVAAAACADQRTGVTSPKPVSARQLSGVRDGGNVYFEFQVEKPVAEAPNTQRPRYPDILRQAGVEGQVLAQFVVDTTGLVVDGSLKILKTSHALFSDAVAKAVPGMRFVPASAGGNKVRQLAQQPFVFAVSGYAPSDRVSATPSVASPPSSGAHGLGTVVIVVQKVGQ